MPDNTLALKPFRGKVPFGHRLVGVFGATRQSETLYTESASTPRPNQRFIGDQQYIAVAVGPDGRWQYEKP